MMSKNALLERLGDRAAAAVADRDLVDRPDRRDLDGRADEEHLVGDVEQLARQHLLAHLEAEVRASVMTESRVMPGRIDAPSGGV